MYNVYLVDINKIINQNYFIYCNSNKNSTGNKNLMKKSEFSAKTVAQLSDQAIVKLGDRIIMASYMNMVESNKQNNAEIVTESNIDLENNANKNGSRNYDLNMIDNDKEINKLELKIRIPVEYISFVKKPLFGLLAKAGVRKKRKLRFNKKTFKYKMSVLNRVENKPIVKPDDYMLVHSIEAPNNELVSDELESSLIAAVTDDNNEGDSINEDSTQDDSFSTNTLDENVNLITSKYNDEILNEMSFLKDVSCQTIINATNLNKYFKCFLTDDEILKEDNNDNNNNSVIDSNLVIPFIDDENLLNNVNHEFINEILDDNAVNDLNNSYINTMFCQETQDIEDLINKKIEKEKNIVSNTELIPKTYVNFSITVDSRLNKDIRKINYNSAINEDVSLINEDVSLINEDNPFINKASPLRVINNNIDYDVPNNSTYSTENSDDENYHDTLSLCASSIFNTPNRCKDIKKSDTTMTITHDNVSMDGTNINDDSYRNYSRLIVDDYSNAKQLTFREIQLLFDYPCKFFVEQNKCMKYNCGYKHKFVNVAVFERRVKDQTNHKLHLIYNYIYKSGNVMYAYYMKILIPIYAKRNLRNVLIKLISDINVKCIFTLIDDIINGLLLCNLTYKNAIAMIFNSYKNRKNFSAIYTILINNFININPLEFLQQFNDLILNENYTFSYDILLRLIKSYVYHNNNDLLILIKNIITNMSRTNNFDHNYFSNLIALEQNAINLEEIKHILISC